MYTYILPGFSPKNKEWADTTKSQLNPICPSVAIHWEHWQTGGERPEDWKQQEAKKILAMTGGEQINVLAKSIGTVIAMGLLSYVNKLILCGIPTVDLKESALDYYRPLKDFPPARILCIQNKHDNHGSYLAVKALIDILNPKIPVICKSGDNHEYPYPEEFINFLTT